MNNGVLAYEGANVDYFVSNFNASGKGNKFYNWMRGRNASDGELLNEALLSETFQTLDYLRNASLKESDITGFGTRFFAKESTSKMSDILVGKRNIELKNKDFPNFDVGSLSKTDVEQVLGEFGAFSAIEDINQYEWIAFSARSGTDKTNLKKLWQKAFLNTNPADGLTTSAIFNKLNPELKAKLHIEGNSGMETFKLLINNLDSDLYKFIK